MFSTLKTTNTDAFARKLQDIQKATDVAKKLTENDKLKIMNEVTKLVKASSEPVKVYGGYAQNLMLFKEVIFNKIFELFHSPECFEVPKSLINQFGEVSRETFNNLMEKLTTQTKEREVEEFFQFLNNKIYKPNQEEINKKCYYPFDLSNINNGYLLAEAHDFDLYSPKPLIIAYEIYKICKSMGYNNVKVREAIHHGTYSVKIFNYDNSNFNVCDITYIEKETFDSIETQRINEMDVVSFEWALIDYYKMFSDTQCSSFRFETVFPERFVKFTEYFRYNNNNISYIDFKNTSLAGFLNQYMEKFKTKPSLITTGFKAYNLYLNFFISKLKAKGIFIKPQYLKNIYYEFISLDYKNDVEEFKTILEKIIKDTQENTEESKVIDCKIVEHRRFCYYTGYMTEFYVCNNFRGRKTETLICAIYDNNNMSIPYHELNDKTGPFKVSSHTYTIYHFFACLLFRLKFNSKRYYFRKVWPDTYRTTISNLLHFQNKFLETYKLSPFDNSPFEFLTISTYGTPLPSFEFKQKISGFKFFRTLESGNDTGREAEIINWVYINISGNVNRPNEEIEEEEEPKSGSSSPKPNDKTDD